MGLLSRTTKQSVQKTDLLPSGTFTVDRNGRILTSTIRSGVASETLDLIAKTVLDTLRAAQENHAPLQECVVQFTNLTLKARDLRGGAIIFLNPTKAIKH